MNLNPQRRDWFFPIKEAPALAAVRAVAITPADATQLVR